jgi:hypothetical protein
MGSVMCGGNGPGLRTNLACGSRPSVKKGGREREHMLKTNWAGLSRGLAQLAAHFVFFIKPFSFSSVFQLKLSNLIQNWPSKILELFFKYMLSKI